MDVYGLIGFPLQHSFSAQFFTEKFRREHIAARYLNFQIEDVAQVEPIIQNNPHLRGLNVTIPYKEKIIPFLDELSPAARAIGAVNTIKIERRITDDKSLKLIGHNTDYIGFKESISGLIATRKTLKSLILGTGGAAKAVAYAFDTMGISWRYVSRGESETDLTYKQLSPEIMNTYSIIVNASPVGTFPHVNEYPDIPYSLIDEHHILYDLVYNPEETLFLKKGKARGAAIKNGLEMLRLQAMAAWRIWNDEHK